MSYFDITAIGNPYMSSLGALGLSDYSYGTYGYPAMSGMTSPYGMGMGLGMYNPAFMAQITQMNQQLEKSSLAHSEQMHQQILQTQLNNYSAHDNMMFNKAMVDSEVHQGVYALADKIREGDQDGVCQEYDRLKATILRKYNDYFMKNGNKLDIETSVRGWIETIYSQLITAQQSGQRADLLTDIKKYGESYLAHGFNQTFLGKEDYNKKTAEETLRYIYDKRINNEGGKQNVAKVGSGAARVAEVGVGAAAGAVAGVGALGAACGLAKIISLGFAKTGKWFTKGAGKLAWIGAAAGIIGDIWWQSNRSQV